MSEEHVEDVDNVGQHKYRGYALPECMAKLTLHALTTPGQNEQYLIGIQGMAHLPH